MKEADRHIQFHVGLGKVASKYLQYEIFPALKGIHYIPTRLFYKSVDLLERSSETNILVSREFDQQFDVEVRRFAAKFPQHRRHHAIAQARQLDCQPVPAICQEWIYR
jgi:hypothetical protein